MIRAEVSCDNDDYGPLVEFDATAWFEKATDEDIRQIRAEDYFGGESCDSVAEYMADHNDKVAGFFSYLTFRQEHGRGSADGYSVRIGDKDAEAWIAANRPHLADRWQAWSVIYNYPDQHTLPQCIKVAAQNAREAEELCEQHNPGCEVLWTFQGEESEAFADYWGE